MTPIDRDPDGHKLELHVGDLVSRLAAVERAPYDGWVRFDPSGTILRTAVAADLSPIERCAQAAYAKYVERIGRKPAPMVADFTTAIAAGRVRIAERDGGFVGYVNVEHRERELHLESVAVLPERVGCGVGRLLVDSVENEAKALGLPRVTLYTNAHMHENLALYHHLGYVETDRRSEDGFDRVFLEKWV